MLPTVLVLVLGSAATSTTPVRGPAAPAYRVGSATSRVAILPVRCERDLDPSLCMALGESIAIEVSREPRLEAVSPRDIDVLLGAQAVAELSSCDRDDCFTAQDFARIDAAYLLALGVGRIGGEARLVARIVDLKRGVVIDRDETSAPARDERAIERAARELVAAVLVRRGLARPPSLEEEERGLGGIFWTGVASSALGLAGAGTGAFFGAQAFAATREITDGVDELDRDAFDRKAKDARTTAFGADILLLSGGALLVAGGVMMLAGAL